MLISILGEVAFLDSRLHVCSWTAFRKFENAARVLYRKLCNYSSFSYNRPNV